MVLFSPATMAFAKAVHGGVRPAVVHVVQDGGPAAHGGGASVPRQGAVSAVGAVGYVEAAAVAPPPAVENPADVVAADQAQEVKVVELLFVVVVQVVAGGVGEVPVVTAAVAEVVPAARAVLAGGGESPAPDALE